MSNRELWLDALRGIGILLSLLGHTASPFRKLIYGFHMPLFFVLSGYLYREEHSVKYYAKRYLVPYFLLCCVNLIIQALIILIKNYKELPIKLAKYSIGIIYSRGTTEWMPNCSPLWFLTCIFVSYVIFDKTIKYFKGWSTIFPIFVFISISAMLSIYEFHKLPWNVDTALMGGGMMYVGFLIRENRLLEKISIYQALLLSIISLIGIITNPGYVSFDDNRYGNPVLMLIGSIPIVISLAYFTRYKFKNESKLGKILAFMGCHTMFFMGFDYFSNTVCGSILSKIGINHWFLVFPLKCLTLYVGLLLWNTIARLSKIDVCKKYLTL